jgi:SHS2 domain-containing protein
MVKYKVINHTADIAVVVYGEQLSDIYLNSAYALFDLITELDKVKAKGRKSFNIEGLDNEDLLVRWLNELIYCFSTEGWLPKEVKIIKLDAQYLEAETRGENFNPIKHTLKNEIKAATYHDIKIEKRGSLYQVQIVFDV